MTKIKKYTFDAEDSVADMVNDCQPPMFIMLSYVKKEDVKLREIHRLTCKLLSLHGKVCWNCQENEW